MMILVWMVTNNYPFTGFLQARGDSTEYKK